MPNQHGVPLQMGRMVIERNNLHRNSVKQPFVFVFPTVVKGHTPYRTILHGALLTRDGVGQGRRDHLIKQLIVHVPDVRHPRASFSFMVYLLEKMLSQRIRLHADPDVFRLV